MKKIQNLTMILSIIIVILGILSYLYFSYYNDFNTMKKEFETTYNTLTRQFDNLTYDETINMLIKEREEINVLETILKEMKRIKKTNMKLELIKDYEKKLRSLKVLINSGETKINDKPLRERRKICRIIDMIRIDNL